MSHMPDHPVAICHPLWERLCELNVIAAERFPSDYDRGFGRLGLLLHQRLENCGYWLTPTNTLAFASTGGNGVHFSFLIQDGAVNEASPVVLTIPAGATGNHIVGETLFDFLCLGCHRGWFALEIWPCPPSFEAYQQAVWEPTSDHQYAAGFGVDDHQQQLLDFLVLELGLKPWGNVQARYEYLQAKYGPSLVLPAE